MASAKSDSASLDNSDRVPGFRRIGNLNPHRAPDDRGIEVGDIKCTPGPWQYEQVHDGGGNPLPEYEVTGNVDPDSPGFHVATVPNEANARLIAATFDMFADHNANAADLEYLVNNIDAEEPLSEAMFGRVVTCLDRSLAALAKARAA